MREQRVRLCFASYCSIGRESEAQVVEQELEEERSCEGANDAIGSANVEHLHRVEPITIYLEQRVLHPVEEERMLGGHPEPCCPLLHRHQEERPGVVSEFSKACSG